MAGFDPTRPFAMSALGACRRHRQPQSRRARSYPR